VIELPIPKTFLELFWLALGIVFGRAFGKQLDHDIQQVEEFKKLPRWLRWIIKRLLDFTHHWWIGGIIMISYDAVEIFYFGRLPVCPFWFGYGLFIDDIPDVPKRVRDMLNYLFRERVVVTGLSPGQSSSHQERMTGGEKA